MVENVGISRHRSKREAGLEEEKYYTSVMDR